MKKDAAHPLLSSRPPPSFKQVVVVLPGLGVRQASGEVSIEGRTECVSELVS